MNKFFNYSFSVCASFFLVLSLNVISQEIEEVVVTATKKEESVQDLALSIEAFTEESLEANMVRDANDLQDLVPGLSINKNIGSGGAYTIRGVGSFGIGAATLDSVIISTNGHDSGSSSFMDTGFFDIERIEVSKGPQGTLSGRNAVSGLINVITKRPTADLEGNFEVDFGNHDAVRSNLTLNIPFSDRIFSRLALTTLERDGFATNMRTGEKFDDRDAYGGRFSLDFLISESTMLKFTTDFYSADDKRLNIGTSFCEQHGLYGCNPFTVGTAGTPPDARGSTSAIFAALAGLEQTANVNSYAGVPIYDDFRKAHLSRVPTHESRYSFTQLELEHDLTENILLKVKASHQTRLYMAMQDNDYSHPIDARTFPGPLAGVPGFPTSIVFDRTYGGTNYGGNAVYGFTEETDRDATYEFANADFNSNQFEINLISNFDGPLNFTVGLYSYDSRSHNRFQVQTASWGMAGDFSLHPYSKLIGNGAFDAYGGLDFYQTLILGGYTGSDNCALGGTPIGNLVGVPPAAAGPPASTLNPACLGFLLAAQQVYPFHVPITLSGYVNDAHVRTKANAALGEIYYDLSEDTQLTVGFRYNEDTVMDNNMTCLWVQDCENYTDAQYASNIYKYFPTTVLVEDSAFAYKVAISHDVNDGIMVYGNIATAVTAGGSNPSMGAEPDPYDPEETTNIELGIKSLLFGGKMLFNATLFQQTIDGLLIPTIEDAGAVNNNVDTEVRGLEGNFLAFISETASIDLTWGLFESEIVGDQTLPDPLNPLGLAALLDVDPTAFIPGVGCATATGLCGPAALGTGLDALPADPLGAMRYGYGVLADGTIVPVFKSAGSLCATATGFNPLASQPCPIAPQRLNIKGNSLPGMPDTSYSVGINNDFMMDNGYLSARLAYKYTSERAGEPFNSSRSTMPETKMWDLSFTYNPNDGDWFLKAYIKNLNDDQYIGLWSPASALQGGAQFGTYTDPRTYGLAFGSSF